MEIVGEGFGKMRQPPKMTEEWLDGARRTDLIGRIDDWEMYIEQFEENLIAVMEASECLDN